MLSILKIKENSLVPRNALHMKKRKPWISREEEKEEHNIKLIEEKIKIQKRPKYLQKVQHLPLMGC